MVVLDEVVQRVSGGDEAVDVLGQPGSFAVHDLQCPPRPVLCGAGQDDPAQPRCLLLLSLTC